MHSNGAKKLVDSWQKARDELDAFLKDPEVRDVLLELNDLINKHNEQLDAAVRAVKSAVKTSNQDKLVVGCIGAQKKYKRYYDADFLANALPADQADEVLTEKVIYTLDTQRLEQLLRQGEIDREIVQSAFHEEEMNPASMPGTPKPFSMPHLPVLE